ncbi:hypothetical protein ACFQ07_01840 [Actinomadura adrarensis]|uniref:Uncharacterized protein n=1 Tax=Actinomadura adrarensis TaxID=1819600 RepID=A0ABW3CB84_9ACTN
MSGGVSGSDSTTEVVVSPPERNQTEEQPVNLPEILEPVGAEAETAETSEAADADAWILLLAGSHR